jgi:hypothetical protein
VGATNANSFMQIDTVTFTGCLVPAPAPTITKSFSPDPIVKGANSTLTFTITNTSPGNVAQTGIHLLMCYLMGFPLQMQPPGL